MGPFTVLVAGPYFADPGGGPLRDVVVRWPTGGYGCYAQDRDLWLARGREYPSLAHALWAWHALLEDRLKHDTPLPPED